MMTADINNLMRYGERIKNIRKHQAICLNRFGKPILRLQTQ